MLSLAPGCTHSRCRCADVRADNIVFTGLGLEVVEAAVAREAPLIDGTFELEGKQYPIFRSLPLLLNIPFDISANDADLIRVIFSKLHSGESST